MRPFKLLINELTGLPRAAVPGDGLVGNFLKDTPLTTAGAGTILAALMATGFLLRTGPGAAVNDTLDTAANILAAYPSLQVNDTIDFYFSNNVGFAITIVAGTGGTMVTAAANNVIAANTGRLVHIEITAIGATPTYDAYVI